VKPPAPSHLIADYLDDVSSVLIESPQWTEIDEVMPSDKGARHALAAAFLPDSFRHTLSRSSTASKPTFNSPRSGLFYAFVEGNLSPLLHCPSDFTGRMVIVNSTVAGCP
jgi:hypothetical protein